IRHSMMTTAGTKPATNSATAEVLVTCAITIMKIAGGTSMPIAVPAAIREAESRLSYPALVSGGISAEPSAETSAIFDPQMSEKKYATTITDMPSPPLTQPISARASSTSAWLMPQRSIRLPANTKAGIASSTQLCEPETSAEESCCSGKPPIQRPATPATASANTIGIESRISATKMTRTASSIMDDIVPASVQWIALRRRREEHREPVDDNQDAADERGCVEPGEVDLQPGRPERAVEQAELVAVPGAQRADADDQQMIEAMDPELGGCRQVVHEHMQREMRARLNADRGADQREPGERHLAQFLHPGERHRIDVEPVRDGADEVAQHYADQQVDDRKNDQRRHNELGDVGETSEHAEWTFVRPLQRGAGSGDNV